MRKIISLLTIFMLFLILLLSACNTAQKIICGNCSAANPETSQFCANCGTAFFQGESQTPPSETQSATSSVNSEPPDSSNELIGVWKTDVDSPASADILIFNSDNTFYSVNLGNNIPFYDVHSSSLGTYRIDEANQLLILIDKNGKELAAPYTLTEDSLSLNGVSLGGHFYREFRNSDTSMSFIGDWSVYGSNDKVLTIKQDGTFQFYNATFGDNFSSGTYTKSSNVTNAIDLYAPNGDYVYTIQQLCADLIIDENGTRFLYQKINN